MTRKGLYLFVLAGSIIGVVFLLFTVNTSGPELNHGPTVCLIKSLTGVPCPSCGSTRSMISIFKGEFALAFNYNPIGYILTIFLILGPLWIIKDLLVGSSDFYIGYQKVEIYVRDKKFAYPAILLLLFNWIWNLFKYL